MAHLERTLQSAIAEQRSRESRLKTFLQKAGEKNFELVRIVPYDGDCLFSSVLGSLSRQSSSSELRRSLVDFYSTTRCPQELKATIDDAFLTEVAQPYKDVQDDRVMKGLCEMLAINIDVLTFSEADSSLEMLYYKCSGFRNTATPTINIGHIKDHHFVPLRQKKRKPGEGNCPADQMRTTISKRSKKGVCSNQPTMKSFFSKSTVNRSSIDVPSTSTDASATSTDVPVTSSDIPVTSTGVPATSTEATASPIDTDSETIDHNLDSEICDRPQAEVPLPVSHGNLESSPPADDIAFYVRKRSLFTNEDRKHILSRQWSAAQGYKFPQNTAKRRYNKDWEKKFKWLCYSPTDNGAYCSRCICFSPAKFNTEFISVPFQDWKNARGEVRGVLNNHEKSEGHQMATEMSENFLNITTGQKETPQQSSSRFYEAKVQRNTKALKSIIDVVIVLGQRGLALRGDYNKEMKKEDGNFQFFVDWKSSMDKDLKYHLESAPQNAKYLSPQTQNEFIECIDKVVRKSIVTKIAESHYFSVLADETTDSATKEQMALCVRYLDRDSSQTVKVAEDFLGFVELKKQDAETISNSILDKLQEWGLPSEKMRGQGYDGAQVMSGHVSGVQARITAALPRAKYFTHDANHRLNLVIVATCNAVPEIRNFMQTYQKLTFFLGNSAKRKEIVKSHVTNADSLQEILSGEGERTVDETELISGGRKAFLPTLCDTRWLSRGDSISALLANFEQIYDALADISTSSSPQSSSDAMSYLHSMEQFTFIYAAVLCQYLLAFVRPLSVALQSKQCNLVEAHENAQLLINTIHDMRDNATVQQKMFDRASTVANKIGVVPSRPRRAGRQRHRANAATADDTVESHFKVNYFLPFVDHILSHLQDRFPPEIKSVLLAAHLIPANLDKLSAEDMDTLVQEFDGDLPAPTEIEQELMRWRGKWNSVSSKSHSLLDAVNSCNDV